MDNTWNIRLGDIVPLPPPYMYPPNMHINEILLGIVRAGGIEAPLRVIGAPPGAPPPERRKGGPGGANCLPTVGVWG